MEIFHWKFPLFTTLVSSRLTQSIQTVWNYHLNTSAKIVSQQSLGQLYILAPTARLGHGEVLVKINHSDDSPTIPGKIWFEPLNRKHLSVCVVL